MKLVKKIAVAVASLAMSLSLAACSEDDPNPDPTGAPGTSFTVGVAVLLDHPSLQAIRDGFADVMNEKGLDITYIDENAQGDSSNAATIASSFHDNADLDLIVAITTSIAQAVVNVEQDRPVVYSGVTDPAVAGLMPSVDGVSGTNVTGTSDLNPESTPIAMIKEFLPSATTVGVIYSSAEPNSVVQVEKFKEEAAQLGVTIKEVAITNGSEIATGVAALEGVDAIMVPTDNTVVAGIATVVGFGEQQQIPVFSADTDSVSRGVVAASGLSYYDMGRATGEIAYRILVGGEDPGTIPGQVPTDQALYLNVEAATRMGLTVPAEMSAKAIIVEDDQA